LVAEIRRWCVPAVPLAGVPESVAAPSWSSVNVRPAGSADTASTRAREPSIVVTVKVNAVSTAAAAPWRLIGATRHGARPQTKRRF
jgi:hypothetical protein